MKTKLVYKDYEWVLTVDGVVVPNTHVLYDGLSMRNDNVPFVEIKIDDVEIEQLKVINGNN